MADMDTLVSELLGQSVLTQQSEQAQIGKPPPFSISIERGYIHTSSQAVPSPTFAYSSIIPLAAGKSLLTLM